MHASSLKPAAELALDYGLGRAKGELVDREFEAFAGRGLGFDGARRLGTGLAKGDGRL